MGPRGMGRRRHGGTHSAQLPGQRVFEAQPIGSNSNENISLEDHSDDDDGVVNRVFNRRKLSKLRMQR